MYDQFLEKFWATLEDISWWLWRNYANDIVLLGAENVLGFLLDWLLEELTMSDSTQKLASVCNLFAASCITNALPMAIMHMDWVWVLYLVLLCCYFDFCSRGAQCDLVFFLAKSLTRALIRLNTTSLMVGKRGSMPRTGPGVSPASPWAWATPGPGQQDLFIYFLMIYTIYIICWRYCMNDALGSWINMC